MGGCNRVVVDNDFVLDLECLGPQLMSDKATGALFAYCGKCLILMGFTPTNGTKPVYLVLDDSKGHDWSRQHVIQPRPRPVLRLVQVA